MFQRALYQYLKLEEENLPPGKNNETRHLKGCKFKR